MPLQSLRQSIRSLLRQPGLALLAIIALGLGIGLPSALFSLVDASVWRGLPVEDGSEIVHLERRRMGERQEGFQAHARDYVAWRERQRSLEDIAAFTTSTVTLRSERGTDRWNAAYITSSAFGILANRAALGRVFTSADEQPGAPAVVLLGHSLWRDRFAGDRAVLGSTVFVDGTARTVVGVLPDGFHFPGSEDLWLPLAVGLTQAADPDFPALDVFGRLRDGVSRKAARAEFAVIAAQLAEQYPATNQGSEITVKRFTERFIGATATATMYVMLAAVLLVLLIACINVANLLLVRAIHRVREIAVRSALGASRARIARHLVLEAGVLAVLGGALGIAIARAAHVALTSVFVTRMPYWAELRLDPRVLLFALVLTLGAVLLAALLPAYRATSGDLSATLYDAARGSTGLRASRVMRGLIVLEVALSFGLLVATGLLVRGVRNVQAVPLGFATQDVFTGLVTLPVAYDAAARERYFAALRRSLEAVPAVSAVTVASSLPATRTGFRQFAIEGNTYPSDDDRPAAHATTVADNFFATFGALPLRGRAFTPQDTPEGEPVVIVNARFAERFFPEGAALGRRIRMGNAEQPWRTIVGVVPNLWIDGLDSSGERNPAGVYLPASQVPPQTAFLAVRVRGEPAQIADELRAAAFRLAADVPLYSLRSMPDLIVDNSWFYAFGAGLMGVCGLTALLLAIVGLYGVIAFAVGRRTREFGIRIAVGASPAQVVTLVLRGSGTLAIGLVLGAVLAYALARGVASLLFQVSPTDPLVFGGAGLLLAVVGIVATLVPAVRAARVDPLTALRSE